MLNKVLFSKHFTKRMLMLAVITAVIISTSMPLTYIVFMIADEKDEARTYSQLLAGKLLDGVRANPLLWQYNVQKFTQVFSQNQKDNISDVKIYNENGKLIYDENISKTSIFKITGRSPITYNNRVFGYIEIWEKTDKVIWSAVVLAFGFTVLGLIVGVFLYRFPTRMVSQAEHRTSAAFEKLKRLSYHDPLTNLPNRVKLNEYFFWVLELAESNNQKLAVMFLDLDRFKMINDSLGHSKGDILLKAVAERLSGCVRENEAIARQGGDEFIIVIPNITNMNDVAMRAEAIIDKLSQAFVLDGNECYVTASIGISIYPTDGNDMVTLVKNADAAMFQAKEQGKNRFNFYNDSMKQSTSDRLVLESGLRKALERDELCLHYQPVVDLRNGNIKGVEALVRWQHPKFGLMSPGTFINLAEETGQIIPIGEWVLKQACLQNKEWQDAGYPSMYVSVNLSAHQFQQNSLVSMVANVLKETGLPPQHLYLEITESIAMYNEERVIPKLHALKNLGVKLAIDDFGIGYSSLKYLKRFPVDILKVDQTFVSDITTNRNDAAIVAGIIAMARSLNLEIVAEGVENEVQRSFLELYHCHTMQGNVFCKPLPAEELMNTIVQYRNSGRLAI